MDKPENSTALIVGNEVKAVGLAARGRLFVFSPVQTEFLLSLQKMKNVNAAALSVSKDEAWGQKFLKSRKFTEYMHAKLEEYSVKNGLTPEFLISWGMDVMRGKREWFEGTCSCGEKNEFNKYELAQTEDDDLEAHPLCKRCYAPIDLALKEESFKPSREQVVAYQELKATIIPKIERVHHQYENVDIVFESAQETG